MFTLQKNLVQTSQIISGMVVVTFKKKFSSKVGVSSGPYM